MLLKQKIKGPPVCDCSDLAAAVLARWLLLERFSATELVSSNARYLRSAFTGKSVQLGSCVSSLSSNLESKLQRFQHPATSREVKHPATPSKSAQVLSDMAGTGTRRQGDLAHGSVRMQCLSCRCFRLCCHGRSARWTSQTTMLA